MNDGVKIGVPAKLDRLLAASLADPELLVAAIRELSRGEPVTNRALARAVGRNEGDVAEALDRIPNVERDDAGRLVGLALTLTPTAHTFELAGRRLYTWCALDTLIFPAVLGETAHVSTRCPATGAAIKLVVTPLVIEEVDPTSAVMSLVEPSATASVRDSFCDHVSFYASRDVARQWLQEHSGGEVVPLAEAHGIALGLAARVFGGRAGGSC